MSLVTFGLVELGVVMWEGCLGDWNTLTCGGGRKGGREGGREGEKEEETIQVLYNFKCIYTHTHSPVSMASFTMTLPVSSAASHGMLIPVGGITRRSPGTRDSLGTSLHSVGG